MDLPNDIYNKMIRLVDYKTALNLRQVSKNMKELVNNNWIKNKRYLKPEKRTKFINNKEDIIKYLNKVKLSYNTNYYNEYEISFRKNKKLEIFDRSDQNHIEYIFGKSATILDEEIFGKIIHNNTKSNIYLYIEPFDIIKKFDNISNYIKIIPYNNNRNYSFDIYREIFRHFDNEENELFIVFMEPYKFSYKLKK